MTGYGGVKYVKYEKFKSQISQRTVDRDTPEQCKGLEMGHNPCKTDTRRGSKALGDAL